MAFLQGRRHFFSNPTLAAGVKTIQGMFTREQLEAFGTDHGRYKWYFWKLFVNIPTTGDVLEGMNGDGTVCFRLEGTANVKTFILDFGSKFEVGIPCDSALQPFRLLAHAANTGIIATFPWFKAVPRKWARLFFPIRSKLEQIIDSRFNTRGTGA